MAQRCCSSPCTHCVHSTETPRNLLPLVGPSPRSNAASAAEAEDLTSASLHLATSSAPCSRTNGCSCFGHRTCLPSTHTALDG